MAAVLLAPALEKIMGQVHLKLCILLAETEILGLNVTRLFL